MSTERLEAAEAKAAKALAAAPPEQEAGLEQRWRQAAAALASHRLQVARQAGDLEAEEDALEDLRETVYESW